MVSQPRSIEHFVTLFDSRFLLLGLTLHESLQKVAPNSHLWVICMDELVEHQINKLDLEHVTTVPLLSIETDELRSVKSSRTVGEYCWTLTPFAPSAILDIAPDAERVTYLDSDLFFFRNPEVIFKEFELSNKHVLITEHAYAPGHDRTAQSGRFCVQFMTFRRSQESMTVIRWWQDRCVEWCFDRIEDGKFGDQKYLDQWPVLFPNYIHILRQVDLALAPWNVDFFLSRQFNEVTPVFYHFQSFRIVGENLARLYINVSLSERAHKFYSLYLTAIVDQIKFMSANGIALSIMPEPIRRFNLLRKIYVRLFNKVRYAKLDFN